MQQQGFLAIFKITNFWGHCKDTDKSLNILP